MSEQWKLIGTVFTPNGSIIVCYAIPSYSGDEVPEVEEEIMAASLTRLQKAGCGYYRVPVGRRTFNTFALETQDHPVHSPRWHKHLM